jgi:hypothetical protein
VLRHSGLILPFPSPVSSISFSQCPKVIEGRPGSARHPHGCDGARRSGRLCVCLSRS